MFFQYKMRYLAVSKKKIHYSGENEIENSDHCDHRFHHSASHVMPIGDPQDRFFYPTLTLMIDSFSP